MNDVPHKTPNAPVDDPRDPPPAEPPHDPPEIDEPRKKTPVEEPGEPPEIKDPPAPQNPDRERMKPMRTLTLGLTLLGLTACTSFETHAVYDPDENFDAVDTFTWVAPAKDENPAESADPALDLALRNEVKRALEKRGLRPAADGEEADVEVAYYTAVDQDVWVSNWNYPYSPYPATSGVYRTAWGYHYGTWYRPAFPRVGVQTIGTLVIDFIDPNQEELIWRGWARGAVRDDEPKKSLTKAVDDVFERYPSS